MTYLPPEFFWPVDATTLWAPGVDEVALDDEAFTTGLQERDEAVSEQFRRLRSSMSRSAGEVVIPFALSALTLTNQASTEQFLNNSSHYIVPYDLTFFTQARLVCRVTTGSASGNTPILSAKYDLSSGGLSTTVTDYSDLSSDAITCSLTSAGVIDSGWGNLPTAAKDDVYLTVTQEGGDGAADPVVGMVMVYLR